MTVIVKTNLPDFKRQIQELGRKFAGVAVSSNAAAAREFVKDVKQNAQMNKSRMGTGRLSRAVVLKRGKQVPRGTVLHIVGVRQGKAAQRARGGSQDAFYWRFLEFGWVPRKSRARERGEIRKSGRRGDNSVKYPFIDPAFKSAGTRALRVFYERVQTLTTKVANER